tara:strand:- start:19776 stop:21341 length:1566 start_codon:yes stop_codon:yes gene_type:complete
MEKLSIILGNKSRREVLQALAYGSVSLAGGMFPSPATAATETPKYGGHIRVASLSISISDTLDPARGTLSTDYMRQYMIFNGLTSYNEALGADLALAERIETDDNKRWIIYLRNDVVFHGGKSLHADDVVFSLMRHKDPQTASIVNGIAAQFETIRVKGALEVEINLVSPNADLPVILADSHFLIVPSGTTNFNKVSGTGPYRIKEFNPGVNTVVVRNENYWKNGKPYLDEIELIGIPDETSRVNALLAGDIHLTLAVNPRSEKRIRQSGTHSLLATPSGLYTSLIMSQRGEPTNNPDFVMAMKYMFDRKLIRRALFRNFAEIANDHPIQPGHKYYMSDLPQRSYDPDKARFHLKKAGMIGVRIPVYASPAAEGSVDMGSILQETSARVGLKLAVNRVPADGYWSNHWMKHPLGFGNTNARPTADMIFSQFYKSDAPWNESGWHNEQFDQLLLLARAESEEMKRRQMYGDMQQLIHKHCGVSIPVFINLIDAFDNRIKGLGAIPTGGLMGYSFAEHVWLNG